MKLLLINIVALIILSFANTVFAENFTAEYNVSTSGIKIGKFNWFLEIKEEKYQTVIDLKNSGIFSPLYKFEGQYTSIGIFENNEFKAQKYKQYWKTKNKLKIVEMFFNEYLIELFQNPKEKEIPRIDLDELYKYYDPLTSFINILNGNNEAKTIDGRRVYIMKKINLNNTQNITLQIKDYKNIWADHKRNDLKEIKFFMEGGDFLPKKINVYFKDRVFKLKKI